MNELARLAAHCAALFVVALRAAQAARFCWDASNGIAAVFRVPPSSAVATTADPSLRHLAVARHRGSHRGALAACRAAADDGGPAAVRAAWTASRGVMRPTRLVAAARVTDADDPSQECAQCPDSRP